MSTCYDARNPALTIGEKQFLKLQFGGEFKFLLIYGLSIHSEEDRAEGRLIMRAMMFADHGQFDDSD